MVVLVVVFAVVVGLLPPGRVVSGICVEMGEATCHYRVGIASSIGSVPDMCIQRYMMLSHSSLVRRIAHMLDFEL